MADTPIEGLMQTAMSNIKAMVDVNTIVGTPVTTADGTVIIPVSTVSFGFAAGGSEFEGKKAGVASTTAKPMFGGGSGGGANVKPVGFLVVGNGNVRLLPATESASAAEKIIDLVPELVDKANSAISGFMKKKKKSADNGEQQ